MAQAFANSNTLFVGDLSSFTHEGCLVELFAPFGDITEVRVKRSADGSKKSLCYGFVRFAMNEGAASAMQEMDGYVLNGRAMR